MTTNSDLSVDGAISALAGVSSDAPDAPEMEREGSVIDDEEEQDDAAGDDAAASDDEDNVDADSSDADDEGEADPDQEATDDAESEGDEAEQSKTAIEPPTGLDEKQRAVFKKLPREAQQIVADHDRALVADHTRKTQALAADRKELQSRIANLREVKTEKQKRIEKWQNVDWAEQARKLSPQEYNRNRALMEKEMGEYQSIETSLKRQEQTDYVNHVREQAPELQRIAPHLAGDNEKAKTARREIMETALKAGYTQESLRFMSAFEMHSLWKAQQWDKYQAEKAKKPSITAKKNEQSKGRVIRPAARTNPPTGAKGVVQGKFKRAPTSSNAIAALNAMDVD